MGFSTLCGSGVHWGVGCIAPRLRGTTVYSEKESGTRGTAPCLPDLTLREQPGRPNSTRLPSHPRSPHPTQPTLLLAATCPHAWRTSSGLEDTGRKNKRARRGQRCRGAPLRREGGRQTGSRMGKGPSGAPGKWAGLGRESGTSWVRWQASPQGLDPEDRKESPFPQLARPSSPSNQSWRSLHLLSALPELSLQPLLFTSLPTRAAFVGWPLDLKVMATALWPDFMEFHRWKSLGDHFFSSLSPRIENLSDSSQWLPRLCRQASSSLPGSSCVELSRVLWPLRPGPCPSNSCSASWEAEWANFSCLLGWWPCWWLSSPHGTSPVSVGRISAAVGQGSFFLCFTKTGT